MSSKDDNLEIPAHERMSSLATAKASANALKSEGSAASELGQDQLVAAEAARTIVQQWPEAPKKAAEKLLEYYGPPNDATPTKLFWYRTGPWSRIELTADEVVHNFPTPHTDYLTQYVDYPVPATKAGELLPPASTADPDEAIIAPSMGRQMVEEGQGRFRRRQPAGVTEENRRPAFRFGAKPDRSALRTPARAHPPTQQEQT